MEVYRHTGSAALDAALTYAAAGWPVFPCIAGEKAPVTRRGFCNATTDPRLIRQWWRRRPDRNVAIATGAPGPDVLDVDNKPAGTGFPAYNKLARAGLITGAGTVVRTPSGGLHVYFLGTSQRSGRLPGQFIDFKAAGGYVVAPPSVVGGNRYVATVEREATGWFDWPAALRMFEPPKAPRPAVNETRPVNWAGLLGWLSRLEDGQQRWKHIYGLACVAAKLIAAGEITTRAAWADLMAAAESNGFIADHGARQAERKIARGLRDGAQ